MAFGRLWERFISALFRKTERELSVFSQPTKTDGFTGFSGAGCVKRSLNWAYFPSGIIPRIIGVSDEPGISKRKRKTPAGARPSGRRSCSLASVRSFEGVLLDIARNSSFKHSGSFSNTHVNIRLFRISNNECQTP